MSLTSQTPRRAVLFNQIRRVWDEGNPHAAITSHQHCPRSSNWADILPAQLPRGLDLPIIADTSSNTAGPRRDFSGFPEFLPFPEYRSTNILHTH